MRSRLGARLKHLEQRGWTPPSEMRGTIEMHCIGGLGHVEGERCLEHENCVYRRMPILGRVVRQYLFSWHEGMANPFDVG